MFAEVALNLPIDELFYYRVPEQYISRIKVGMRVLVPFKKKELIGFVVKIQNTLPDSISKKAKIKEIKKLIDPGVPSVDTHLLALTKWVADYYFSEWGTVLAHAVPKSVSISKSKTRIKKKGIPPELEKGYLSNYPDLIAKIEEKSKVIGPELIPTPAQKKAIEAITASLQQHKFNTFLLYGVTASGKTEVYLQSIAVALKLGYGVLILVPEIILTYQLIKRVCDRFGANKVAVLHSGLSAGERYLQWTRIKANETPIAIGVRSAVFAPVQNLGLIIVDEEHESTYKSDSAPKYNAKQVAIYRAKLLNATIILGSATPSVESFYYAYQGRYHLLNLPERVDNLKLPTIKIIDLKKQYKQDKKIINRSSPIFSACLISAIEKRLAKNEQVILFLNRRGFSSVVLCRSCGESVKCANCAVPLTYHKYTTGIGEKLICHYCGEVYNLPVFCPNCRRKSLFSYLGVGTQQVEEEIKRLFPQVKLARLDLDITRSSKNKYMEVLEKFINGEIDILVGTQLIAKGIDIPRVTLVGVINADVGLCSANFRTSEWTYSLLTQVAGRAGRGKTDTEIEVIVQTYNPTHFSYVSAAKGERETFYLKELQYRKKMLYPPYRKLILVCISHKDNKKAESISKNFVQTLKENLSILENKTGAELDIQIYGPAPALIPKIKKLYRYHILLKGKQNKPMRELIRQALSEFTTIYKISHSTLTVDNDPLFFQ